jgi:hypothetical protein
MAAAAWPDLDLRTWGAAKKTLHLSSQMLGKLRLALEPDQPEWMFTRLFLNARGFTTGPMPLGAGSLEASLDVFDSHMRLARSDGRVQTVALLPPRTIAAVFADFRAALDALGVRVTISPVPQEVADVTPFDRDNRDPAYDPAQVQRWFGVVTAIAGIFDAWRSHFFGRTGIQLWWGGFDLALLLFSGKKVPPPADRGYMMRFDLDAEMMNVGFYTGDDATPAPYFFGYIYPQPPACETVRMAPEAATWSTQLGLWMLPYDAGRAAADPAAMLNAFCDSIYDVCGSAAGWDRAAHVYDHPKRRR